jgi:hypothetical protein
VKKWSSNTWTRKDRGSTCELNSRRLTRGLKIICSCQCHTCVHTLCTYMYIFNVAMRTRRPGTWRHSERKAWWWRLARVRSWGYSSEASATIVELWWWIWQLETLLLVVWYRPGLSLYVVCSFGAERVLGEPRPSTTIKRSWRQSTLTPHLHSRTPFRRSPTQEIGTEVKTALTQDVCYATEDSRDTDERDSISVYDHRVLL